MSRKRLQRADWLDLALERLSAEGPEALKLEAVCKAAGVTRGSFYHHFGDHGQFLAAVAQHWSDLFTSALVNRLPAEASPAERDAALTEMAIGLDYHLELGIRELARRDAAVAGIVHAADQQRLEVLTGLYAEKYGVGPKDARMAARLEYASYIGTILTDTGITEAEQHALAARFQTMLAAYFAAED